MEPTPSIAIPLLQTGIMLGIVLLGNVYVLRHLPVDAVPSILRGRIELANRMRPWLAVAAVCLTVAGLVLQLA
jgi:hypothetical protein